MNSRILIVDDEIVTAMFFAFSLSSEGYETRSSDGSDINTILQGWTPTVLLTDLDMPNKTGFQLAQELKRRLPSLNCFAFTGHCSNDMVVMDHQEVFKKIFQKPLTLEEFVQELQLAQIE